MHWSRDIGEHGVGASVGTGVGEYRLERCRGFSGDRRWLIGLDWRRDISLYRCLCIRVHWRPGIGRHWRRSISENWGRFTGVGASIGTGVGT